MKNFIPIKDAQIIENFKQHTIFIIHKSATFLLLHGNPIEKKDRKEEFGGDWAAGDNAAVNLCLWK